LNALDVVILVFLALGAYSGYKQGLFISILSIFAFVIALILAFHFMDWGAQILAEKVTELTFGLPFMAFILIFLGRDFDYPGIGLFSEKNIGFYHSWIGGQFGRRNLGGGKNCLYS
jgi:membrane protein required for colicin V production